MLVISFASWSLLRSPNRAVEEDGISRGPQRISCCLLPVPVSNIQASSLGFNSSLSVFWHLQTTPPSIPQRYLQQPRCPPQTAEPCLPRTPSRFWIMKTSVCSHCFLSLRAVSLHIAYDPCVTSLFLLCFPGLPNYATDSLYHTPSRCIWYVFCFTGWRILMDFNWHSYPC